jgi:hypothetical protein
MLISDHSSARLAPGARAGDPAPRKCKLSKSACAFMKHICFGFVWLALAASISIAKSPPSKPVLIWSDEFDGSSIDTTKWNVANDYYHCCNDELQIYTEDEVFVKGGNLILRSSQRHATLNFVTTSDQKSAIGSILKIPARVVSEVSATVRCSLERVAISVLICSTNRRSYDKYNYTSGWVDTSGKFSTLHGRVEVRAKLPSGKGL